MNDRIYNAALLSNYTIKGLDSHLKKAASRYGVEIATYVGEYGQWQQEILGEKLYAFKPDIVYVIVDFEDMAGQLDMVGQLALKTSAKIILCNKVLASVSALDANTILAGRFKDNSQVIVFDFNAWLSGVGKENNWNTKYRELGDMRLSPNAFGPFGNELAAWLIPLAGKTKKCLALDLDNTLWGGIVGEEGMDRIALGPKGAGRPFYELQKYIKSLPERGVILAIASSNNEADAKEVLQRHEQMLLREDDFAAIRANWNNKPQNLREIAAELNIGLDSLVFIDDDPRNRELVRRSLPEVEVLEMPADPAGYVSALRDYKGFTTFGVTSEDKKRAQMYADEKKRRAFQEEAVDLDSFLKGLELIIAIRPVDESTIPRAAQLTQKTNQFNLTTRRYQEEDVKNMLAQGFKMWILEVKDKFGEYGLAGLIIVADRGEHWEIDTFLLSCRVLGKRVEEEFFSRALNALKAADCKKVIGAYLPTAKNEQVKDFYQKFGFRKRAAEDASGEVWEFDLSAFQFKPLNFIKTII